MSEAFEKTPPLPADEPDPASRPHQQDTADRSVAHLSEAVRKTLSRQVERGHSNDISTLKMRNSLERLQQIHGNADGVSEELATDLVSVLASWQLPAKVFAPTIKRWSGEIARQLLDDPIGRENLEVLWGQMREKHADS